MTLDLLFGLPSTPSALHRGSHRYLRRQTYYIGVSSASAVCMPVLKNSIAEFRRLKSPMAGCLIRKFYLPPTGRFTYSTPSVLSTPRLSSKEKQNDTSKI